MFYKKILLLKRVAEEESLISRSACGICRVETENEVTAVSLSLVGFPALGAGGEYRLYLSSDDGKYTVKNIGKSPTALTFTVNGRFAERGVSAGLWLIKDDVPLLLAYQKSDDAKLTRKEYSVTVINDIIEEKKTREKLSVATKKEEMSEEIALSSAAAQSDYFDGGKAETGKTEGAEKETEYAENLFGIGDPENGTEITAQTVYDDERVAKENYFKETAEINEKLLTIKELCDERLRNENGDGTREIEEEQTKGGKNADFIPYETDALKGENGKSDGKPDGESGSYYEKVKDELSAIFTRFPAEEDLTRAYKGSVWAKIFYGENKYYVVGLIKEDGKEKYICYGVPSKYSESPPKELSGYCSFVPLSIFDLKGDGYFMMFQDAATGKCVRKDQA
ncbi:MAG: hypothetical protein IJQ66_04970 [Clostridia bacterium]|nr:hypothetical protein [Clostridia bacterium]